MPEPRRAEKCVLSRKGKQFDLLLEDAPNGRFIVLFRLIPRHLIERIGEKWARVRLTVTERRSLVIRVDEETVKGSQCLKIVLTR